MALTYPLALSDWFDLLPIGTAEPPSLSQALSGTRTAGGETIVDRIGVSLWQMQLELGRLTPGEATSAAALIEAGIGPGRYVFATPLQRQYPQADPDGTALGAAAPYVQSIDRTAGTITIHDLPVGYQVTRGDFFSIDFGAGAAQVTLHRAAETMIANGLGRILALSVEPGVPVGPIPNDPVRLIRPRMKAVVAPDSYSPGRNDRWMTTGISLRLMQTLR